MDSFGFPYAYDSVEMGSCSVGGVTVSMHWLLEGQFYNIGLLGHEVLPGIDLTVFFYLSINCLKRV